VFLRVSLLVPLPEKFSPHAKHFPNPEGGTGGSNSGPKGAFRVERQKYSCFGTATLNPPERQQSTSITSTACWIHQQQSTTNPLDDWTTTPLDNNPFGQQPFWTTTSTLFDNYWRRQPSATLITTLADDNININIDGAATSGLYAGFRTVRSVRPQPHPITDR
jgi:hypothetical protein